MKEKFLRFMQGRYGLDQFSKALLIGGLIVVLLSSFFAGGRAGSLFYLLGWILIIYCYFRKQFERKLRLDETVDALRDKYGEDIICRAKFSDGSMPHMAGGLSKERRTGVTKPVPKP